jgi:hypothetical protein
LCEDWTNIVATLEVYVKIGTLVAWGDVSTVRASKYPFFTTWGSSCQGDKSNGTLDAWKVGKLPYISSSCSWGLASIPSLVSTFVEFPTYIIGSEVSNWFERLLTSCFDFSLMLPSV